MSEMKDPTIAQRSLDAVLAPWVFVPNAGLAAFNASVGAAARLADTVTGGLGDHSAAQRLGALNDRLAQRALETASNAGARTLQAGRATLGQGKGEMPAALAATVFETGVRTATLPVWLLRSGQSRTEPKDDLEDSPRGERVAEGKIEAAEAALAAQQADLARALEQDGALAEQLKAQQADLARALEQDGALSEQLKAQQADLARALEQNGALAEQLKAQQAELDQLRDASRMNVKSEKWTDAVDGASSTWAKLPTPMELTFEGAELSGNHLLVFVHFSRLQHRKANSNTEFRILVNGEEAGSANTGNSYSWTYRDLAFHGLASVTPGTDVRVEVEYKTMASKLLWAGDNNGPQERQLTAIDF